MAAAIGAFAMGALVIASEAGLFTAPSLYGPAGGLSGRSTLAVVAWGVAWAVLHARWRGRSLAVRRIFVATVALVASSVIMTFPPVWQLL
jgi:hypothetical protein